MTGPRVLCLRYAGSTAGGHPDSVFFRQCTNKVRGSVSTLSELSQKINGTFSLFELTAIAVALEADNTEKNVERGLYIQRGLKENLKGSLLHVVNSKIFPGTFI